MTPAQIPCPKPLEQLKLLVHHHMSHLYMDEIRARFPRLSLTVLDNYAELRATLEREQPDMMLSFRMGHHALTKR